MTIYMVEMGIRIIARGFMKTEFSYIRDPWNSLELFEMVIACLVSKHMLVWRVLRLIKPYVTVSGDLN